MGAAACGLGLVLGRVGVVCVSGGETGLPGGPTSRSSTVGQRPPEDPEDVTVQICNR